MVSRLPGFTLSGSVKRGAAAEFVPVGSLPKCSPGNGGVLPEVLGASRSAEKLLFHDSVTRNRGYTVGGLVRCHDEASRRQHQHSHEEGSDVRDARMHPAGYSLSGLRGERAVSQDNNLLGKFHLDGIPSTPCNAFVRCRREWDLERFCPGHSVNVPNAPCLLTRK